MKFLKKSVSIILSTIILLSVFTIVPVSAATTADTWASLQAAVSDGGEVSLSKDITAGEKEKGITVGNSKNVTLDLCGHVLSRGLYQSDNEGFVIYVSSGATLTIKDSSGDNSGKITGGHSKDGGGVYNDGTLNIQSGQICENVASDNGGGVLNKGTLNVSGGIITNNVCKDGGGIFNTESGTVNLTDNAWITANKTSDRGGGGISNNGTMTVRDNVRITANYANTDGGGICNGGILTVSGGSITDNNATKAGSGICNRTTLNMQGAPIVKDNYGDDVALYADRFITLTGALTSGARIGVTSPVEKAVVTKNYGKYNSNPPKDYFFENGEGVGEVTASSGEVKLNTEGLPYVDRAWNKNTTSVVKTIKHLTDYTPVTSSLTELKDDKWYVVQGSVTIGRRINNNGKAKLLLLDGSSIEFSDGIRNEASMNSDLNIYGQQAGIGKLCAANSGRDSAIGGNENNKTGSVSIFGGTIDLQKNRGLYSIGSAPHSAAGKYYIYGADVWCGGIGCGIHSATDDSAYIGIFNSRVRGNLHNGAGVLDIYNSSINGGGAIYSAACIGGHTDCTRMGDINIYNSYVLATTQGNGAAIGSNKKCDGGTIRIINSSVDARATKDSVYGSGSAAAIGGGSDGLGGNVVIDHSFVSACATIGAGIGGGKNKGGTVGIKDSIVLASSSQGGAGIGGGDDAHGGSITIEDSFVHCKTESKQNLGAYSGKNFEKAFYSICMHMMSKMTNGGDGSGSQVAFYHMGFLAGYFLTLLFAPTHGGAAIGGGDKGDSGDINISGSVIIANGGKYAAGIGGGYKGGFNNITITDSTVTANGGEYAAGIGSGNRGSKTGTVRITGSDVTSNGGLDAAGIGGGNHSDGGVVDIISSTVKANGNHYGSGIGGGDANNYATVRISGNSTVEAVGGGSGNATALGTGDYNFSKPKVTIELGDGLEVLAGNNERNSSVFYQNERYDAARSNSYVKVSPCSHSSFEWKCENQDFHKKVCKNCGVNFDGSLRHNFSTDNICTECKASSTPCTMTLTEKNSGGENVNTTKQIQKYAFFELPACENVPDNCEFVGWKDSNDSYYIPGDTVKVYQGDTFTAVYLPLTEVSFIDSDGEPCTAKVRQMSADVPFFSTGQYAATADIHYMQSVMACGLVDLIIADGVTVDLNGEVQHPFDTRGRSSDLTLYGQQQQSGTLRLENQSGSIGVYDLIMNGGRIQTTGGVSAPSGAVINRGTLNAKSLNAPLHLEITGGNVNIGTVTLNSECVLGWTEQTDSVQIDRFLMLPNGSVTVMEDMAFTDGDEIYQKDVQPDEIVGKKLTPCMIHHYGDPEWKWSEDHETATATFRCTDEGCEEASQEYAKVTREETSDNYIYTARVAFRGTEYTDVQTVSRHTHALDKVEEVMPSCDRLDDQGEIANGSIGYWHCRDCGKNYSDEACTKEISLADTVVPYITYIENDEGAVCVERYNGSDPGVIVPETVPMNYPVESLRGKTISVINAYSFENSNITYIAMGDSVRTLGWHAFNGCGALRSADIGSGLDFIYSEAFNNCPELRSFYTTTQKVFLNGKYYNPFTGSTKNVTVYGYHDAHLHSKVAGVPYVGIDRHSEPTWSWSEEHDSATAHFKCSRCSIDKSVMTDDIDTVYSTDKTVYTASTVDGLESYTSSAEGDRTLFTGHSLSLNGSIGVNFYINLTEEEAKDATVRFTWTVEENEKSHTVSLKDVEKHPLGYKATCPIAIAEMTYNINATLTLGDEVYNDTYSAINYADEILYSDDFAEKYVAEENESGKNGEARLQQLQQLVKTMLDYGAKAQLRFERNTDYLANDGEDFFSDEVTLTDQSSDMNEHLSNVGLEYMGTSVVYLSGTTLRHYYKIVDPDKFTDQVKNSVTFNGEAVRYGEKDGLIYFDKKNIAAPELDVRYVINIGGHDYHYSALDYSALSYNADEKPYAESITKQLAASVYRYNQAANVYFEG